MSEKLRRFSKKTTESDSCRVVEYKVHGFWGYGYVRIIQGKSVKDNTWGEAAIVWSCGGRDFSEEPDSSVANACFVATLNNAIKCAQKMT